MKKNLFIYFFYYRFLEFFSPGAWFVVTAIMIRAVHATGNACVITSTFTYCAIEYDQAVGQIFVSFFLYCLTIYHRTQSGLYKIGYGTGKNIRWNSLFSTKWTKNVKSRRIQNIKFAQQLRCFCFVFFIWIWHSWSLKFLIQKFKKAATSK